MDAELRLLFKDVLESSRDIKEKKLLMNELRKLAPPDENRWNFRFVVWTLALIALTIPAYVLWLMYLASSLPGASVKSLEIRIPEGLLSLGSAAVGALAAFLSPQRKREENLERPVVRPTGSRGEPPEATKQTASTIATAANLPGTVR